MISAVNLLKLDSILLTLKQHHQRRQLSFNSFLGIIKSQKTSSNRNSLRWKPWGKSLLMVSLIKSWVYLSKSTVNMLATVIL